MYQTRIKEAKKRSGRDQKNREIMDPDEGQEYGLVSKLLGNCRVEIFCEDGVHRVGRIRGSMRKYSGRMIVENDDLVLVSRRDYEEDKVDIIHKYTREESRKLMKWKMLPGPIVKAIYKLEGMDDAAGGDGVVFAEDDDDADAESAGASRRGREAAAPDGEIDISAI